MKFELEPHNRNVPEDELLADLKRVAGELQKSSATVDEYNERGRFHATTLIRRLKRPWLKVLELAGLSKTHNLHISKEELFDNLVDVWRKLGRQPTGSVAADTLSLNSQSKPSL